MSRRQRDQKHIVLIAAEDGGIEGAKRGGEADVIRDASAALAVLGYQVTVVLPSYGFLHETGNGYTRMLAEIPFPFGEGQHTAKLYQVAGRPGTYPSVRHLVLHHKLFANPDGSRDIYCHDPGDRPFATDATKFAAFAGAVASAIQSGQLGPIDVLHLHDWHTGFLFVLRDLDDRFSILRGLRMPLTIHNLALQGIRPFRTEPAGGPIASCFEAWFPWLNGGYSRTTLADRRYPDCFNPMAYAIRRAAAVHAVSRAYAEEITRPNDPVRGFHGGEGLERDLLEARSEGRLYGIPNAIEYPLDRTVPQRDEASFHEMIEVQIADLRRQPSSENRDLALGRLERFRGGRRPPVILTTVSRLVDQKVGLMLQPGCGSAEPAIVRILRELQGNGLYLMHGMGVPGYEAVLQDLSRRHEHFVLLGGFYTDACAAQLYSNGDWFLMPSSWEPCGIAQMLAMRDGQPCIVHSVGGLKDTVRDGIDGLAFTGTAPQEQAEAFVDAGRRAIAMALHDRSRWQQFSRRASRVRFHWEGSVRAYAEQLYGWSSRGEPVVREPAAPISDALVAGPA